jgi:hypothetical protein
MCIGRPLTGRCCSVQCTSNPRSHRATTASPQSIPHTDECSRRQLFNESPTRGGDGYGGCELTGIPLNGDKHLANLGSTLRHGDDDRNCVN